MQRLGIAQVRPLAGGIEGWRRRGYPLVLDNGALSLDRADTAV